MNRLLNHLVSKIYALVSGIKLSELALEPIEVTPPTKVIIALIKTVISLVSLIKALIELLRKP